MIDRVYDKLCGREFLNGLLAERSGMSRKQFKRMLTARLSYRVLICAFD